MSKVPGCLCGIVSGNRGSSGSLVALDDNAFGWKERSCATFSVDHDFTP